jgi:hypothetical protein
MIIVFNISLYRQDERICKNTNSQEDATIYYNYYYNPVAAFVPDKSFAQLARIKFDRAVAKEGVCMEN